MREDNFIAFWLVFGFFIGMTIGFFSWNDPFDILFVVILSTLFFYMTAHVSIALFVRFMETEKVPFEKYAFERRFDDLYNRLLYREAEADADYSIFSKYGKTADACKRS